MDTVLSLSSIKLEDIDKKEKLYDNIKNLPDCIKKYIYYEFLETENYYKIIKKSLDTEESQNLNINCIRPLIPLILVKKKLLKYLCEKIFCFNIVYNDHKIKNNKCFVLMQKGDSFALSILMYLYH
jgi:hypothetical protein